MIFVGRKKEIELLEKNVNRLDAGKSSVVFIDAEPGTGKTALVHSFLKRLPENKFNIAIVECDDKEGIVPYGAINRLYQQLQQLGIFSKKSNWKDNFKKLAIGVIGDFMPGGNTITAAIDVFGKRSKPNESKPNDDKQQLIEDILKASTQKPLIIFWDDLQWIDSISATFIFSFCKTLRQDKWPVYFIGTYRPHEVNKSTNNNGRHPLADKINELRGYTRKEAYIANDNSTFSEFRLPALHHDEVVQLVNRKFPKNNFPTDFISEHLYKNTEGNALFANSILDLLVERGGIVDNNGTFELREESIGEIPNSVQGIIKERYDSLGKELKKVLDVASINGYDFTIQIIERILKIDKGDLLEQLEELERQHNLFVPAQRKNIQGKLLSTYSFTHALIHKYIYDNVTDERRIYLHEKVADLLTELYGTKDNMPQDVREQYENHVRISQGFEYSSALQLTQRKTNAENIDKFLEALTDSYVNYWTFLMENGEADKNMILQNVALQSDPRLAKEIEALVFLTSIFESDDFDQSKFKKYADTYVFNHSVSTTSFLMGNKSMSLLKVGKYQNAIKYLNEAIELFRKQGDRVSLTFGLHALGHSYREMKQYPNAIESYNQAIELSKELNDIKSIADILSNIGLCYMEMEQYPSAIELYNQAIEVYTELNDRENLACYLYSIGFCYGRIGEYLTAIKSYNQAIEIYRELNDRKSIARILVNKSLCYIEVELYQYAIEYYNQAIEICRELDDRESIVEGLGIIGSCYAKIGQYQNAIEFYNQTVEIYKELNDSELIVDILLAIGFCYAEMKQYSNAIEYFNQALEICKELGNEKITAEILDSIKSINSAQ